MSSEPGTVARFEKVPGLIPAGSVRMGQCTWPAYNLISMMSLYTLSKGLMEGWLGGVDVHRIRGILRSKPSASPGMS